MDRILLHIANAITLICAMAAMIMLVLALIDTFSAAAATDIYLMILALALVPYCFTGTLHRIVRIDAER